MIVTWEGLALLASWWLTTVGAAIWIERRLAKMEVDIAWLITAEQRRLRTSDTAGGH